MLFEGFLKYFLVFQKASVLLKPNGVTSFGSKVDRADVTSTTPLMLACRLGYAGVLKVLLDAQVGGGL